MQRPAIVAHADWGLSPRKRWVAIARLNTFSDTYEAVAPSPDGDPATLLRRLAAEGEGSALAGFDFPIGVPMAYAEAIGVKSFRSLLALAGNHEWRDFYRVAERPSDISLRRPFYPQRPGGCSQSHLVSGLGVASIQDLLRECERATATRRQACCLFWTLGGNQVGKAAITGWRDVLAPALQDEALDLRLWPFDGALEDLLGERIVVVETYPTEFYWHLGVVLKTGKRDPNERRSQATAIEGWRSLPTVRRHVEFSEEATSACLDGFGSREDGEDPFDAFIGLLGMLNVVLRRRAPGWPVDPNRRAVEGWILGQDVVDSERVSAPSTSNHTAKPE